MPATWAGSTLAEVLISILIMSIGIVSLATLFPISALRTLHATQFTHATIVRYNAESLLDTYPTFLGSAAALNTTTGLPLVLPGNVAIIDPIGYWEDPAVATATPASPPAQPSPTSTAFRFGGSNVSAALQQALPYRLHGGRGMGGPNLSVMIAADQPTALKAAQSLCALNDTWSVLHEGLPSASTATSVDFTVDIGVTGATPAPFARRIVIYSADGLSSVTRSVTNISYSSPTTTVTFSPAAPAIPGRVVLETQVERYTWLLTARRDAVGNFDCDVVVYFKRPYSTVDEQSYLGPVVPQSILPFRQNSTYIAVEYPTATPPFIRRGGFVLDAENGYWYRILDYSTDPASQPFQKLRAEFAALVPSVVMTAAQPAPSAATNTVAVLVLNRKSAFNGRQAIFQRGVVDVYPIGTKAP